MLRFVDIWNSIYIFINFFSNTNLGNLGSRYGKTEPLPTFNLRLAQGFTLTVSFDNNGRISEKYSMLKK